MTQVYLKIVSHPLGTVIGPEVSIRPKQSQSGLFPEGRYIPRRKMSRERSENEWNSKEATYCSVILLYSSNIFTFSLFKTSTS